MSETAQVIWAGGSALTMVLGAIALNIWAIRCDPDSPNYRSPRLNLPWWRDNK
ncbi:MAG: hypothetical protein QOK17_1280 [Sphingomonadales bacterium]|jgi:hypothetical protein|nr:hypothetical protein [Sphingomonadales bacterium]